MKHKTLIGVSLITLLTIPQPLTISAVEYSIPIPQTSTRFIQTSDVYNVGSEGISTHYSNTTINGVRNGETDVVTSTQDVPGLGEDICVGRPLDEDADNTQYACVVLPESLSDTYNRGDIVLVEYENNDGINGIIPCVVIDFNQTEHGDNLNFVGDFHPPVGSTAWVVEERK